ncbi:hypothetical protein HAX54_052964 [Datura stramonium]|uniref:Uncharacterized protein n=1 Tax=Datura stramonium TaxID=4076 RepID=A0ABS8SZP0_DATST|nr:hypothetical protein [Datura stramonium]
MDKSIVHPHVVVDPSEHFRWYRRYSCIFVENSSMQAPRHERQYGMIRTIEENPNISDEMFIECEDDFWMLHILDPREYYCSLRRECNYRYNESYCLVHELVDFGALIPHRFSVWMERQDKKYYEVIFKQIRKENNRILVRHCRYYILKLGGEQAQATNC